MAYQPNIVKLNDDGTETPMTLSAKACSWSRDNDGGYYVRCQGFRVLMPRQRDCDDNTERNFAFCPYCGGKLTLIKN